jgi:predicted  nucleic acid-binding Zn-ribbon protein
MEQLMAFGVVPSDPDLASKAFADLRSELAKEKAAWKKAQTKVETLTRAIEDLKISTDMLATQISTLEEKVKHMDNKVLDGVTELQARDLYLE